MSFALKSLNIRCIIEVWKGRIFMEWKQLQEAAERLRTQLASLHKFRQQKDAIERQLRHVNADIERYERQLREVRSELNKLEQFSFVNLVRELLKKKGTIIEEKLELAAINY